MQFKDKVAIITGGASGIGLLSAENLATAGAKVVLIDINEDALELAVKKIRDLGAEAIGIETDIRDYTQVEKAVKEALSRFSTIDILINSAGGAETRVCNSPKPFYEQPIDVIDWGIDVNLKGSIYFARAAMPAMIQQKSGVILNFGSVTGIEGSASAAMYSTSKGGLISFTKSLALAGAPHDVRACCVSPGPVMTRPGMAAMGTRLGRAAEPQEVVDLVLYLCSDKAAFITGTNYTIDGGRTCGGMD